VKCEPRVRRRMRMWMNIRRKPTLVLFDSIRPTAFVCLGRQSQEGTRIGIHIKRTIIMVVSIGVLIPIADKLAATGRRIPIARASRIARGRPLVIASFSSVTNVVLYRLPRHRSHTAAWTGAEMLVRELFRVITTSRVCSSSNPAINLSCSRRGRSSLHWSFAYYARMLLRGFHVHSSFWSSINRLAQITLSCAFLLTILISFARGRLAFPGLTSSLRRCTPPRPPGRAYCSGRRYYS